MKIASIISSFHNERLHFSSSLISITSLALTSPSRRSSISKRRRNFFLHSNKEGRHSFSSPLGFSMSSKNCSQSFTCHQRLKDPLTTHRFFTVPTSIYLPNNRQYAAPKSISIVRNKYFNTQTFCDLKQILHKGALRNQI